MLFSAALLHTGISLLLAFEKTSVISGVVPAHDEILHAFILHCSQKS